VSESGFVLVGSLCWSGFCLFYGLPVAPIPVGDVFQTDLDCSL